MFWSYELFGTDVYHLVAAFIVYSVLGWLVESIYISLCERKLTNRGYAKGPFCPIYGFGAVIGYLILDQVRFSWILVYILGAVSATAFEFVVGKLMIRLLGELWWDYREKPFNYKGIICLESTIAWGFYGLGVVYYLHAKVIETVDRVDPAKGVRVMLVILALVLIDYIIQTLKALKVDLSAPKDAFMQRYEKFRARW